MCCPTAGEAVQGPLEGLAAGGSPGRGEAGGGGAKEQFSNIPGVFKAAKPAVRAL